MSLDTHSNADAVHALLANHTNRRQASKILDVHSMTALLIEQGDLSIFGRGFNGGLYAAVLNRHGAFCDGRLVDRHQLALWLSDETAAIDVEHEPRSEFVTDPTVSDR